VTTPAPPPAPSPKRQRERGEFLDGVFFVLAAVAAIWFAILLFQQGLRISWNTIWITILFWVVVAYLVLPRIHRILTFLYVPDYFIGRTRTSDGLLGDPVNLALLGKEAQLHAALRTANWTRADNLSLGSGLKIVASTLRRKSYDEAPVSPLLLFGRQQDFAYQQEVAGNPAKRHHVRFWRAPEDWLLPGGIPVDWLAAGTFDRAVGFSLFTLQVTHKIEENTDIERDFIVNSITDAEPAATVNVIKDFSAGYHSRNGGGDSIVTDGDLPIVNVRAVVAAPQDQPAVETDSRLRRPGSIVIGALLTLARSVTGVFVLIDAIGAVTNPPADLIAEAGDSDVLGPVLWFLVIFTGLIVLVDLLLAFLVFAGVNWARITVMVFALLSILTQFLDSISGTTSITLDTTLVATSIDILLLLALSNDRASAWARRKQRGNLATQVLDAGAALREVGDDVRAGANYKRGAATR
jgi:hypothetical protein